MLADYPPEIPIVFLEGLLLRKKTSIHRLSCAYQYLSVRHAQSRPGWSVLSNEFTEDSFPVRYYDQSPHLQHLKARIEKDAMKKAAGCISLQPDLSLTHEHPQHIPRRVSKLPLPALLIHAKVVVFELQCPTCVRIWHSAVPRILHRFYQHWQPFDDNLLDGKEGYNLLPCIPALQPYFVKSQGALLSIEIHFAFFDPLAESSHPRNGPILCYVVEHPNPNEMDPLEYSH